MMRFNRPPSLREGWWFYLFVVAALFMLAAAFWRAERDARTAEALEQPLPAGDWDPEKGTAVIKEQTVTPPPHTAP